MKSIFFYALTLLLSLTMLTAEGASKKTLSLEAKDIVSGQIVSSGSEVKVVVFLSAKCPCSDSHLGLLTKLAKDFPNFKFYGIHSNTDEDESMAKIYFQKAALPFPILQDHQSQIANQYKALRTPHAFVINSIGDIVYQGGVSNSQEGEEADQVPLRDALEDVSKNKTVRKPITRPLGCTISRS